MGINRLITCVSPKGHFIYMVHKPTYHVKNLRQNDYIHCLGYDDNQVAYYNHTNFPGGDIDIPHADVIYEIPNPFPFNGSTYISKAWADKKSLDPELIGMKDNPATSLKKALEIKTSLSPSDFKNKLKQLPHAILIATAISSTDPDDLTCLAEICCDFIYDPKTQHPIGLHYEISPTGKKSPKVNNWQLFDAIANNSYLPNHYKQIMVLIPGTQGNSEIVGEWIKHDENSHVFEYLRKNSYIPWGHYAANMAHDAIRYNVQDLYASDMIGMRHLYYQRTYSRLAHELSLPIHEKKRQMTVDELETIRKQIYDTLHHETMQQSLMSNSTLWGWNYGYDMSPTGYRLHASHQQIHQQYALIPSRVDIISETKQPDDNAFSIHPYACGDLIGRFIDDYEKQTGVSFFSAYITAIRNNQRIDGDLKKERDIIVFENSHMLVFVPKAQTSQWELHVMATQPIGNIVEADTDIRSSIDQALWVAVTVLSKMGAKMITSFEYSKRFDSPSNDQRLLYVLRPRLPESPGAFSESQLRWINGHYPEDFAIACRKYI